MKPRQLWSELKKYGYAFSAKRSIFVYVIAVVFALALAKFFGLRQQYSVILCVWIAILLPFFLRNTYRNRYEQKRFMEANTYVEQFLYSFQKSGKILTSLEDVGKLFAKGEMHDAINDAIDYMKHTYDDADVEKGALDIIEEMYPVTQITTMHRFVLSVEKNGGEYTGSILLMLDSRRMWADRVYTQLKEKNHNRMQILVSVFVSLILCVLIGVVAQNMQITLADYAIVQVSTLLVLMLDFLIFYFGDAKLSSGIMDETFDDGPYLRAYEQYQKLKNRPYHYMKKNMLKNRIARGLQIVFPQWMMQISLLLQNENVQVAITKSYDDAPRLMQEDLANLIEKLRLYPTEIEPYLSFLEDYQLPEVASAMKMLYSISEGTGGDEGAQISDMIRRNQILLDQSDRLRDEDALAGMYALFLAPQLTGAAKLLADMLVIFYGLAATGMVQV